MDRRIRHAPEERLNRGSFVVGIPVAILGRTSIAMSWNAMWPMVSSFAIGDILDAMGGMTRERSGGAPSEQNFARYNNPAYQFFAGVGMVFFGTLLIVIRALRLREEAG